MSPVLSKPLNSLAEYLRINAIRRMLTIVDVRASEIAGLIAFAVVFAVFEGIGISLLLPILQYAEGGQTAIIESSGPIWTVLARFMDTFGLPVTLPVLLVLAFVPILLRQVVFYLNTWYSAVVSSRIAIRMRMQTLDTVLNADPEFFARHSVGKLVGVLIGQTQTAGAAILAVIRQLSITLLMALYVAILLAISVPLTLVTLVFALLVSWLVKASIVKTRRYAVESAGISQEMMGKIVERMGLMRLIKLRDQKRAESERIRGFSETMRVISVKQARLGARIEVTADPLLMLSVFVTLFIGISVLGMTLAQLGLVLFVLSRLNGKIKEFNTGRQHISQNMAGLLLVQQTTEEATVSNTITGGTLPFEGLRREIVLSDVTFDYPDSHAADGTLVSAGKEVLRGVSATIPAGSFTALVGRSGAGKSTLVELLPRLRDATSGTITYDGTDIRSSRWGRFARASGTSRKARCSSTTPCARTSSTAWTSSPLTSRSAQRSSRRTRPSSTTCPTAWRPGSATGGCGSPVASASASGLRACCSPTPPFSSSTSPRARSTRNPRRSSRRRLPTCTAPRRSSSSHTGSQPSSRPTSCS
jgi:ABC-type multidrug transport system fused ATPase/permease subunit